MSDGPWAACAFDLDGTLLDSHRGIIWAAETAVAEVLPEARLVGFGDAIGARVAELFKRCLPGADPERVVEVGLAFRRLYDSEGWRRCDVFPGVREALAQLAHSGTPCHVVTNKPSRPATDMLALHGLHTFFGSVTSPDSGAGHVDKAAALASLVARLGVAPADLLFVGDTVEDHDAAVRNGTPFLGAAYGYGRAGLARLQNVTMCSDSRELAQCVTSSPSRG